MKVLSLFALISILFLSGCDIFETKHTKRAEVSNYEDKISFKKQVSLNDKNLTLPIKIKEGLSYLQLLDGADSEFFSISGTKVKLNLEALNSTENNGTKKYSVKLYGINSDKSDFIMLLEVAIVNNNGVDNNNSSKNSGNLDNTDDNATESNNTDTNSSGIGSNGGSESNSTDNNSSIDNSSSTDTNNGGNNSNSENNTTENNNSNSNVDNNSSSSNTNGEGNENNSTDENDSSSNIDNNSSNSENNEGSESNTSENNDNSGSIDNNSSSTDNNSSSSSNTNGEGSENNSSDENDSSSNIDNNSSSIDNNNSSESNTTENNNSSSGIDNNNSNGDDTNSSESNTTPVIVDSDNDNIPDNIEALLGMDSNNSDENSNGIKDGLEGDPFFSKEWYIHADGTAMNPSEIPSIVGNDLDLLDVYKKYMGYNNGKPIIVQIVDSGIDIRHEDLQPNIDLNRSLNGAEQGDPKPGGFYLPHGTMLAGIAAARGFNHKGVRGVAPFAKIAGSNWLVQQSLDGLDAAWLNGEGANEIAVTNNSWGTYYTIDTFYEDIMEEGTKTLRNGKGRVYIFASGNARADNADANIQYVINNRFALVVSALDYQNKVPEYSTPGANVWIAAYGGASDVDEGPTIATTYPSGSATETWDEDTKKDYTYAMAGTSAAAPMVTGAVALLLEACPNLGWRDVKYILAKTAKKVDSENEKWVTNSAGYHFNRNYGFGLINTKAAIEMCQNGYKNLPPQKSIEATFQANLNINSAVNVDLTIPHEIKAEWVETTVDIDSQNASNIDIYLTSPSGTKIQLIKSGTKVDEYHIPDPNWMNGGFRFSTGAFLDETTAGNWRVTIENSEQKSALLKSINIKIYGY